MLVVEDDGQLRDSIAGALRSAGFEVEEAADGDALDRWVTSLLEEPEASIDIIVSDLRLPGRSALEAMERMSSAEHAVPFVAVTGGEDGDARAEAERLGVAAFFESSADPDQLCAKVNALLPAGSHLYGWSDALGG